MAPSLYRGYWLWVIGRRVVAHALEAIALSQHFVIALLCVRCRGVSPSRRCVVDDGSIVVLRCRGVELSTCCVIAVRYRVPSLYCCVTVV